MPSHLPIPPDLGSNDIGRVGGPDIAALKELYILVVAFYLRIPEPKKIQ